MSTDHKALQRRHLSLLALVRRTMYALSFGLALSVACLWTVACGDEDVGRGVESDEEGAASKRGNKRRAKGGKKRRSSGKRGKAAEVEAPPILTPEQIALREKERELPESVFIETDENRDPFRSFLSIFTVQALPEEEFAPRPPVLLEDVSLDELRLIAIVSGEGGNPRAMLVDPDGKGWVVRRGDYVGRGERIRLGPGQPEREINWRVVRVRPDRIILVREDPVQAGPPVTRVMRLYPEEEG